MTKLENRSPNPDWDWLKEKCVDCWDLNKHRTIHKDWKSFHAKACPKHAKQLKELYALMKANKLPRLPRSHK